MSEHDDLPRWLLPALCFVFGCAITYAMTKPVINDDYLRGHEHGFISGYHTAFEQSKANESRWFKAGIVEGERSAMSTGR